MKKVLASLLIFVSSLCWGASNNQLLGTWVSNPERGTTLTYIFKKNNKFSWVTNSKDHSTIGNYSFKQGKGRLFLEFKDFSNYPATVIRCIVKFTGKDSFKIYGKRYKKDRVGKYPDKFGKDTIQFKKIKD